eukprot:SAG31_NODE_10033_length_1193_cov_1.053931_1_plen_63_part_10
MRATRESLRAHATLSFASDTCDTFSISALHISIKVPYFSHSGHKNEKVTNYLGIVYHHQKCGC